MKQHEDIQKSNITPSIVPDNTSVYYPVLHEPPPEEKPVLTFNGESLLDAEGLVVVAAYIGCGKSSISSGAILASIINPDADTIGFKTSLPSHRPKALYIECEMSRRQNYKLLWKVYERAGIYDSSGRFITDHRIIIVSTKKCSIEQRKKNVEEILKKNPDIGLLILDGAGDFVLDTNSLTEANQFYAWLAGLSPHVAIICTVHTNSPTSQKGRGHIGSEMLRRADSVLLLRKLEDNLFEATTEFDYGKNRSAGRHSVFYEYSNERNMFVTKTDYIKEIRKPIKKEKINRDKEMCELIFGNTGNIPLSYSYLEKMIAGARELTPSGAKSVITKLINEKIIIKIEKGEYQLVELM